MERVQHSITSDEHQTAVASELGRKALAIGVFCSARDLSDELTQPARELARLIGEQGHDLVWGGSDVGTMHVISHEARAAGAKIIGVTAESLSRSQHKTADEMIVAEDLAERKMALVERSDALVVLAGGTGTLDEVADVIERKKFGHHYKPIIFLNSGGFYEGLRTQFGRMEAEGMLNRALSDIVSFVATPNEAMELVERMQSEHLRPILDLHHMTEHSKISGGHSGASLYRTRDDKNQRFVIKVSEDKTSTKEVKSNTRAYKSIKEAGLGQLIPGVQSGEDPSGRKYIIMPDLGETFTLQARSEAGADYGVFIKGVRDLFIDSLRSGFTEHTESIDLAKTAIQQFLFSLKVGGVADQNILDMVDKIIPSKLASDMSSMFLLDFTPDNIFVDNDKVQFIDPWEQSTFRGSSILTIAQFQTLAQDVYELPGANDADPMFEDLFKFMSERLKLTDKVARQQRLLGMALQFSLSAFTRMTTDPENSRKYYQKGLSSIQELVELHEA